ncbi:MAG: Hint domain-containing protein [Cyanobacteria bacterium J06621_8]
MVQFTWSITDDGVDIINGLDNSTPLTHQGGAIEGTLELNDNESGQTPSSLIITSAPGSLDIDDIGVNLIPGNFGLSGSFDVSNGVVTANSFFLDINDADNQVINLSFDGTLNGSNSVNAVTNNGANERSTADDIGVVGNTDGAAGATFECFLPGTHVLAEKGEVKIEELKIGDKVQTEAGTLEPIKWIGRQTVRLEECTNPLRTHPVMIKAGALGNGLPHRDLYVSPDHSLFVDGLLINAGALVNDISILKTEPAATFTYYHIELDNHCLVMAEGTAAESYLPQKENREEYDNTAEYEELYPHGSNLMLWPMDYPRISSWNKVPRSVSQRLLKIADELSGQSLEVSA